MFAIIEKALKSFWSQYPFIYEVFKTSTGPATTKLLQGVSFTKPQNPVETKPMPTNLVAEFPGFVRVVVFKPSEMERYLKEEAAAEEAARKAAEAAAEETARKAAEAEARGGADKGATSVEAEAEP